MLPQQISFIINASTTATTNVAILFDNTFIREFLEIFFLTSSKTKIPQTNYLKPRMVFLLFSKFLNYW